MGFQLHLTSVGRGHLADSTNAGVQNVQLRRLAVGSGSGAGDAADADARTALRTQEDIADVVGSAQPDSGRIGATATFAALATGLTDVEIREVGMFARVGDDGTEFLLAYGARPADEEALISLTASGRTVVAGVMDISSAAADVAITVDADITFSGLDGATNDEAAAGVRNDRAVTPAGLAFALRSDDQAASTSRRGPVELATNAETQTGTDDKRAVTPAGLSSVLSLITVLHFAASNPTYVWNLPFSRALLVMKGADGGGGAPGTETVAEDGGAGGDTIVTASGGSEIRASGGRGGPRGVTAHAVGATTASELERIPPGGGEGGRAGIDDSHRRADGFNGGRGETVVEMVTGLTPDSSFAIEVGSGGPAGQFNPGDADDVAPADGDDGWVRIIPLPSD